MGTIGWMRGTGKSSFVKALMERTGAAAQAPDSGGSGSGGWVRVSQDELGSRYACEELVGQVMRRKVGGRGGQRQNRGRGGVGRVVIDRCNVRVDERKRWLQVLINITVVFTTTNIKMMMMMMMLMLMITLVIKTVVMT